MIVNVRKCCITGAQWSKGNTRPLANRTLLASRLQNHFVTVNTYNSPIPSIDPSEPYRVLGVELNTSLNFTKPWRELKHTTTSLINALFASLLTQSRKIRVIRGLLIGKHFTLQLGLFSDFQLDTLEGQICRALRPAVSSIRNLPRTALHRPTSDMENSWASISAYNSNLPTSLRIAHARPALSKAS
jgi:hypothetical protein